MDREHIRFEKICSAMSAYPDHCDKKLFGTILDAAVHLAGMDKIGCRKRLQRALTLLKEQSKKGKHRG